MTDQVTWKLWKFSRTKLTEHVIISILLPGKTALFAKNEKWRFWLWNSNPCPSRPLATWQISFRLIWPLTGRLEALLYPSLSHEARVFCTFRDSTILTTIEIKITDAIIQLSAVDLNKRWRLGRSLFFLFSTRQEYFFNFIYQAILISSFVPIG